LRWSNLQGSDLRWSNLQGSDLRWSNLQGSNLQGSNLQGASLDQCTQYVAVIRASRHDIVALDDDIRIGCQRMTLAEWLEQYKAVGHQSGYTEQQIAEYGIYLKAIADVLEVRKNAANNE
jgi:hypothetical protein